MINGETYTKKRAYIENAGIIINSPGFISELTVEENLYEIAKILDRENTKANIDKLLLEFNLDKHRKKKYLNTSLGMKQKMRLIQAFMEDHDIYILDEPTNALDKNTILQVHKIINELKKDKLVIITSHSDIDIKEMADKIYELDEGVLLNEEV